MMSLFCTVLLAGPTTPNLPWPEPPAPTTPAPTPNDDDTPPWHDAPWADDINPDTTPSPRHQLSWDDPAPTLWP